MIICAIMGCRGNFMDLAVDVTDKPNPLAKLHSADRLTGSSD